LVLFCVFLTDLIRRLRSIKFSAIGLRYSIIYKILAIQNSPLVPGGFILTFELFQHIMNLLL
jgi:hypothetical protein